MQKNLSNKIENYHKVQTHLAHAFYLLNDDLKDTEHNELFISLSNALTNKINLLIKESSQIITEDISKKKYEALLKENKT